MAGGGSFSSDQKFTTLTADGNFKTITGGGIDLGPCRVTYIQAFGANNSLVKLHDGTSNAGSLEFQAKFGTEGLDVFAKSCKHSDSQNLINELPNIRTKS